MVDAKQAQRKDSQKISKETKDEPRTRTSSRTGTRTKRVAAGGLSGCVGQYLGRGGTQPYHDGVVGFDRRRNCGRI